MQSFINKLLIYSLWYISYFGIKLLDSLMPLIMDTILYGYNIIIWFTAYLFHCLAKYRLTLPII